MVSRYGVFLRHIYLANNKGGKVSNGDDGNGIRLDWNKRYSTLHSVSAGIRRYGVQMVYKYGI